MSGIGPIAPDQCFIFTIVHMDQRELMLDQLPVDQFNWVQSEQNLKEKKKKKILDMACTSRYLLYPLRLWLRSKQDIWNLFSWFSSHRWLERGESHWFWHHVRSWDLFPCQSVGCPHCGLDIAAPDLRAGHVYAELVKPQFTLQNQELQPWQPF